MWETVKHKKQRKEGIDKQERKKGGRSNQSWAKQRREKQEKKRQEKEKQEKEQQEKEQQEKDTQEKHKKEEHEKHEKEEHEKHEKEEQKKHEKHEKHEKQNGTALDWLQQQVQALKQKYQALEQGIQTVKGNNQRFGEEIDEIREGVRKAFEELQIFYAEAVTGEAHEMTQELSDQVRDDEEFLGELLQEEMQYLPDQVREYEMLPEEQTQTASEGIQRSK